MQWELIFFFGAPNIGALSLDFISVNSPIGEGFVGNFLGLIFVMLGANYP